MQDKNIFQGYEIGGWELGPRIYKIVAAATVLTLLPIFALGQVKIFTTSACDSPFVNTVCDVLDTVYVGTKILAKDTGYSDGVYENIELTENIWVDESQVEPKMVYPVGYFEIANLEELKLRRAALENPEAGFNNPANLTPFNNNPIAPPTPKYNPPRARNTRRGKRKPIFPRKKDKVLDGDISDDPIGDMIAGNNDNKKPEDTNSDKTGENKKPDGDSTASNTNKKPKQNPVEKHTATKSDPVNDKPINREPLRDFGYVAVRQVENNQIDLTKQFVVRMNGVITEEGMLDEKLSGWGKSEGDERMVSLAKLAIEKVGVSGWLKYLVDEGAQRMDIMFGQDNEKMVADVRSDLKDENKAKTAATGLRGLISAARIAHRNGATNLNDDEYELLGYTKVTNDGSNLVIQFSIPKEKGQQIIDARMKDFRKSPEYAKRKELENKANSSGKPSGSVDKKAVEANAGK